MKNNMTHSGRHPSKTNNLQAARSPDTGSGRQIGFSSLDELCVNTIRCLSMDAVQKAKSGHPGMPMGMAPAAYVLWTRHLKHNPVNPRWINRDRFVLSA